MSVIGRVAIAAAAAVAGYLTFLVIEGSRRLVRPTRQPFLPREGAPATPGEIGLSYEDVRFTTSDGVTLAGWLLPAGRETRAAVILLHGWTSHRLPLLALFAGWLQPRYHILQFDFRGHGVSDDAVVTLGSTECRDVAAAVRFAEDRGLGPLALMGMSMGGAVAIVAAPDLPVAAVVTDSAFSHLSDPIANVMRARGWPLPHLGARMVQAGAALRARVRLRSPIGEVARLAPRGLLVIAPTADAVASFDESLRLFDAAREPKELLVVEGAEHGEGHLVDPEGYERTVLAFLERHLDGVASGGSA